jgi:protein CWC15
LSSQPGQGGDADSQARDLRAELLQAEAAHFAKKNGVPIDEPSVSESTAPKRQLEAAPPDGRGADGDAEEDPEAKRRRILEETRDLDADSEGSEDDSSEEERYALHKTSEKRLLTPTVMMTTKMRRQS